MVERFRVYKIIKIKVGKKNLLQTRVIFHGLGASNAPLSLGDAPHIHRSLPSIPNKDDNVLDISENRRTAKVKDLARFNDASAPDVATAYFLPHIRIRV